MIGDSPFVNIIRIGTPAVIMSDISRDVFVTKPVVEYSIGVGCLPNSFDSEDKSCISERRPEVRVTPASLGSMV